MEVKFNPVEMRSEEDGQQRESRVRKMGSSRKSRLLEGHELGSCLLSAGACLGWQVLWKLKYFILSYVMQQHVQT